MSDPCVTGVTLSDPTICPILNKASTDALAGPDVTAPTPVTDTLMPDKLKQALTDCSGKPSCKFIGYDFDSDVATEATASRYVVDTYSTTAENSGVLVSKGTKTSGTISGITADATGGSTGTVTYTASNGQQYTFQGHWSSVLTNGTTVDVYFDPANVSKGALQPDDLGFRPPMLIQPPGYELPDFQSAILTTTNNLGTPTVSSVEECAAKCDTTSGCVGFNFGGIDTSTVCELVSDTSNRAYRDNTSGFRKEKISTVQTGDGSNPSGTDLSNEGEYCRDVQACNADIARIITENVGSSNPIATLSTNDIESCAYCPVRTYATAGNITTNELGVSKSNPTPAEAIAQLQYSKDGTSATHLNIIHGGLYNVKQYVPAPIPYGEQSEDNKNVIAISGPNNTWTFAGVDGVSVYTGFRVMGSPKYNNQSFTLVPVEYVTNGFRFLNQNGQIYASGSLPAGMTTYDTNSSSSFPKYSKNYNMTIWVFNAISFADFMNSIPWQGPSNVGYTNQKNPFIFRKGFNGDAYKIDISTRKASKFDPVMLQWYVDLDPSLAIWVNYQQVIYGDVFWTTVIAGYDNDMPDPYAALGQFRTLDVAPPSTAQTWAYNIRQGCDKNCGNVPNGYAIYNCTASGGGNCDPGKGAYVSGDVCSGTYTSCRPADDSTDLKNQFSFKFRGLLPASTKVMDGGSNSDHNTDALRIRTIYTLDPSFSVSVTPNESVQKLYSIFPTFVIDRMFRTKGLESLVPPAMCAPGLYVKNYGFGLKACDICPGNPTLTYNQVFQPDTTNPGNFMCTVITCPTGQVRDLMTNRCRVPCQPGQYVAADGSCATCPDQTLAGNQYWMPDLTNVGSSTCTKNQCPGNQYVNSTRTGCLTPCQAGYGPDPVNPGQCIPCTVTPARLQKWVWESLGFTGGQVVSYKCDLTTCPDGQYPASASDIQCYPCSQPSGLPSGITATFGQGCAVKACSVDPSSPNVASATVVASTVTPPANCGTDPYGPGAVCQTVGSCSAVCKPGFTGTSCTPCPQPPGIKATYSTACIATSCSVDTSSPDASKVTGATLTNGNCLAACSPGYWKYFEYGCYACGARKGDDPMTSRVYALNSCDPASCTVDASLVGKATAAPATVPGTTTSVCMLTPSPGYTFDYGASTSITGDYVYIAGPFDFRTSTFTRIAYSVKACPAGDPGTTYTYSSGCSLATCTYTNPNDPNETATQLVDSSGNNKCTKVCKAGYKRDSSGKCTVTCPQPSDLGLTTTFGSYGCKISTCTSSSGFPTSITPTGASGTDAFIYGDTCSIMCPAGSRQYTNTNASPVRQDCAKCSTDLSLNPWIFNSTCSLISNYCSMYGPIFQANTFYTSTFGGVGEQTATATQSGSTCTTTCNSGYVKDRYGVCRKCPNETPSSTSSVINGICVTTCKTNHTRDETYDAREFNSYTEQPIIASTIDQNGRTGPGGQLSMSGIVCPQCTNGTYWDSPSNQCISCSSASTASTKISPWNNGCTKSCNPGYYLNLTTGNCDVCPAGYTCPGGSSFSTNRPVQCSAGNYCPAGATSQTQCSIGYSCPAGSGSQTACGLTPVTGYIWTNPRVDCTTRQCRAGYYCPDTATETVCRWNGGDYCPAGTVSPTCPAGYYCSDYTSKTQCTAGYSCPAGSSSQTACAAIPAGNVWLNPRVDCTYRACAAGYYCPNATTETMCTKCAEGTYTSTNCTTIADAACTGCPGPYTVGSRTYWYYCTSGKQYTCPSGSKSVTGANFCLADYQYANQNINLTTSGPGPLGGSALINTPGDPGIYLPGWTASATPYLKIYASSQPNTIYIFKAQGKQYNNTNGQWSFYGDFINPVQTVIARPFSSLTSAVLISATKST